MKIAIPSAGNMVNQHFGMSKSFAIATIEGNSIVDIKEISTESLQHNHGGLAGLLTDENVNVVIAGGIGAGAYNALKQNGLDVVRGASGEIKDAIQQYIGGNLKDREVLCNHHGHEHHHHE